jgi:hypothetical protein
MTEEIKSLRDFPVAIVLPKGARERLELCIKDGVYALRTFLQSGYRHTTKRVIEVQFALPATFFQHFKMQYYPSWLKRLYPVRMDIVTKKVEYNETIYLCPHLTGNQPSDHEKFLEGE